jgi:hypothetical protein
MSKSEGRTPTIIPLILGLIGGSAGSAVISFFSTSSIEDQKFTYSLIQQALETDDFDKRLSRLTFMNELGLFDGDSNLQSKVNSIIEKAKKDPNTLPQLPPPVAPPPTPPNIPQPTQSIAIVIGGDSSHKDAIGEVKRAANNGYSNAQIYLRQSVWRTVIPFVSAEAAEAALPTVRNFSFKRDAFKIDLNVWCSSQIQSRDNIGPFTECKE